VIFLGGLGRGRGRQHLPRTLVKSMRSQLATLVRGSSVTAHCLAATALLTREYQGDHRRQDLISAAAHATDPLTSPSISDFWTVVVPITADEEGNECAAWAGGKRATPQSGRNNAAVRGLLNGLRSSRCNARPYSLPGGRPASNGTCSMVLAN